MDALTREAQEHGQIFESIAFLKQSMATATPGDYGYVEKVRKFLQDSVVEHFKYEEKRILLPLLEKVAVKDKFFIRELQIEHINILKQIDLFDEFAVQCKAGKDIKVSDLRSVVKVIIRMMLKHTQKEDLRLFPLLEKYPLDK